MVIFFFAGIPIAFAIALMATGYAIFHQIPLTTIAQRFVSGSDSFPLMAAPLFMVAGLIMSYGGTTRRLLEFSNAIIGHIRGGVAHVCVIASMIFAGMTGSATAEAGGLGPIEMKMLTDSGYDKKFSAAIVGASSTIGPIIPPSVPFVIYGAFAQVSVGRLLLGGAIPGVFMGLYLMGTIYFIARKKNFGKGEAFSFKKLFYTLIHSAFELLTPVIIMGGIISGIFTPTEAAVIAVVYALVLEIVIRREINIKMVPKIFLEAGKLTGAIMFIIASASAFNWVLMREGAGEMLVKLLVSITTNRILLLLLIMLILLILGCFIETIALIIISVPILAPLSKYLRLDPIHLGVIVILAIVIGLITPPVGLSMYVVCAITKLSIGEFSKAIVPFLIVLILVLITVAFVPFITLFLPNLLMGQ